MAYRRRADPETASEGVHGAVHRPAADAVSRLISRMEHREPPLVSVGIPVFNGENSIARALDSLLEQDYPHIEIVISDNGSTDGTQAICERYARMHRHVTYSRVEPNAGAPANFNR